MEFSTTNNKKLEYKNILDNLELGKRSSYETLYNPKLLQPVPRSLNRDTLSFASPFFGYDLWHMFELSCLNTKGKPLVFIGELFVPCNSTSLIESKSLKLYLNSFNQTKLSGKEEFTQRITDDLNKALNTNVLVNLYNLDEAPDSFKINNLEGINIDDLDVEIDSYDVNPQFLAQHNSSSIKETLTSNLLKSNCLITSQPDWGSISITYEGAPIVRESLLKYLISFRNHNEFHEHCVERIFTDLLNNLNIKTLTVKAFYTRRGGLDINPLRSTNEINYANFRLLRQ
jgi:7-cyano-7-deazaguanine reductase